MQVMQPSEVAAQAAYDYFNRTLFETTLPACEVILRSGRIPGRGFSAPAKRGGAGNRIILDGDLCATAPAIYGLQALVHEMLHLWQYHFGNPTDQPVHNDEFAAKSISVGLMPSSTGGPGGDRIGDQIIEYAIGGGLFERIVPSILPIWSCGFPGSSIDLDCLANKLNRPRRRLMGL